MRTYKLIKKELLLCSLLFLGYGIPSSAQESSFTPSVNALEDLEWGTPGGGNGFPVGVRTVQLGVDPVTNGKTYFALFPAGSHFDLHWHTHDEFVVVVQGEVAIELGDETHVVNVGAYIVIPGKVNHSWDVSADGEDVIILVRRGGPADFNFVQQ